MTTTPQPTRASGSRLVAAFALTCAVAAGLWWGARAREATGLALELAPYADAPLPAPDDPVDEALAGLGSRVFEARCAGCHHMSGEPRLGPNLAGVTLARDPAWLRAMIQRPDSMTREDPIARALLEHYGVQMLVAGGMDDGSTRAVLEFLRRADRGR